MQYGDIVTAKVRRRKWAQKQETAEQPGAARGADYLPQAS
jgi:hypothetical protein